MDTNFDTLIPLHIRNIKLVGQSKICFAFASEFIDVGKQQRALDALYDAIKSKKHRQWTKTHEQIMEKYLELCVELKKSHIAKEGLYQYKNISQTVRSVS